MQAVEATYQLPNTAISLYYTLQRPALPTACSKAAVIVPPLGRLGGSSNDHVVRSLARQLLEHGWSIICYDPRGAGKSGGSGSWSGVPEADDFQVLLSGVVVPLLSLSTTTSPSRRPQLLLAGYSNGSLSITRSLPPSGLLPPETQLSYLLVSYPLSVRWALTLCHTASFVQGLDAIVADEDVKILLVWGDRDQFSGKGKLRSWAVELKRKAGRVAVGGDAKRFRAEEITGADHFWVGEGKKERLLEIVEEWCSDGEETRAEDDVSRS